MFSGASKLNLTEYEFIWRVDNFDYFFFSFWLNKEYKRRDFLFTNKNNQWKTYIGREQRKKLSGLGMRLMTNDRRLKNYGIKANRLIRQSKKLFEKVKKDNHSKITSRELAKKITETAQFCREFWAHYFFSEYFCYDGVEEVLVKNLGSKTYISKLKKNVHRMQKIKFNLRKQLNKSVFGNHVFLKLLNESAKRLDIKFSGIMNLGWSEITEALISGKLRASGKEIYVTGYFNNWKIISGRRAKKIIEKIENYEKKHAGNILRGQTGNGGKYIGRVKIIPFDIKVDLINEIKKMKKGDVLVSGSTGPEMILACKKAGAIVTEEGGITSHAATISREFGIPSVIGTKIATEILKDGDLIEVDADRGIVRVLKKAKR